MREPFPFESAVMGILAVVAGADGRVDDAEAAWWLLRRKSGLFARLSHDETEDMLRRTQAVLDTTAWAEAIAMWARLVPADQAERVYAAALDLQRADGVAAVEERTVIRTLAAALVLSPERASAIAEAVRDEGGGGI